MGTQTVNSAFLHHTEIRCQMLNKLCLVEKLCHFIDFDLIDLKYIYGQNLLVPRHLFKRGWLSTQPRRNVYSGLFRSYSMLIRK